MKGESGRGNGSDLCRRRRLAGSHFPLCQSWYPPLRLVLPCPILFHLTPSPLSPPSAPQYPPSRQDLPAPSLCRRTPFSPPFKSSGENSRRWPIWCDCTSPIPPPLATSPVHNHTTTLFSTRSPVLDSLPCQRTPSYHSFTRPRLPRQRPIAPSITRAWTTTHHHLLTRRRGSTPSLNDSISVSSVSSGVA